jgi:hypothetical protein
VWRVAVGVGFRASEVWREYSEAKDRAGSWTHVVAQSSGDAMRSPASRLRDSARMHGADTSFAPPRRAIDPRALSS